MIRRPPRSTLFPYTTLFRSQRLLAHRRVGVGDAAQHVVVVLEDVRVDRADLDAPLAGVLGQRGVVVHLDRKSTRLNSSHLVISYAVFCLKKKTQNTIYTYSR